MASEKHRVVAGEHVSAIAANYGFARYTSIWDAEGNAGLRDKRSDPHQLLPGDLLVIPNQGPAPTYVRATGAVHTMVVNVEKLKLRFRVLDFSGKPASGCGGSVVASGESEVCTDGEGIATAPIARDCVRAQLEIGGEKYTLAVGGLGPIEDLSAQAARLLNLGCWYGDDEELDDGDALALATELFQKDHGLEITGKEDAVFVAKLRAVHDGKE